MNTLKYFIRILVLTVVVFTTGYSETTEQICYKIDKKEIKHTIDEKPEVSVDVIIDITDLKKKNKEDKYVYLSFGSRMPIPYANTPRDFYCMSEGASYECVGDDDGGRMQLRFNNDELSIHIDYARMADTTDDPWIHKISSKNSHFTKTSKSSCFVSGIFESKEQSKLPYVCYDKRVQDDLDDKKHLSYRGCIRYNMDCKSLNLKHFGKYPNDYESNKAFQRCKNSKPKFSD